MLEPGQRIERQLAVAEQHRYQIAMSAGQFVHVIVEQEGVDVSPCASAIPTATPSPNSRTKSDRAAKSPSTSSPTGTGTYTLIISAAGARGAGAYAVRVECDRQPPMRTAC